MKIFIIFGQKMEWFIFPDFEPLPSPIDILVQTGIVRAVGMEKGKLFSGKVYHLFSSPHFGDLISDRHNSYAKPDNYLHPVRSFIDIYKENMSLPLYNRDLEQDDRIGEQRKDMRD